MEITGKIKFIDETKTYGNKGFKKRELVLTTEDEYPQHILLEFIRDKVRALDKFNIGDFVKIGINLRGREWTSPKNEVKYFNSIQGWFIDKAEKTQGQSQDAPQTEEDPQEDLPF